MDSSFARPGPVVSNHTTSLLSSTSSSISRARPTGSTFPELLDSHLAVNFTRLWNTSVSRGAPLSVASGAAADQLPSSMKTDAILNAASLFLGISPAASSSLTSLQAFTLKEGPLPTSITSSSKLSKATADLTTGVNSGTVSSAPRSSVVTSIVVVTMKARNDVC